MIVMTTEITINGASSLLVHLCLIHFTNKTMNAANAGISKIPHISIIKLPNPAASPDIISFITPFYRFIAIKAMAALIEDELLGELSIENIPVV